ncbi:MAG: DNA polymerase III subunit chi [Hyphomicrobium sp.]|nr:DNA polymerase III subunit chi [Hyphomicrobium sp.]
MSETTEILFYHLETKPLEAVLPALIERTLERGWRAVVQAGSQERLDALDLALWTYRDDSFLPHGTAKDGFADAQPVYLTTGAETPNGAGVRFLVDGAETQKFDGFARLVFLFDGSDADAVARAREQWKSAKASGLKVSYWKQGADGRWESKG